MSIYYHPYTPCIIYAYNILQPPQLIGSPVCFTGRCLARSHPSLAVGLVDRTRGEPQRAGGHVCDPNPGRRGEGPGRSDEGRG